MKTGFGWCVFFSKYCYFYIHAKGKVVLETIQVQELAPMPVHSGKNVMETKVVTMIVKFETRSLEKADEPLSNNFILLPQGTTALLSIKEWTFTSRFINKKFSIHKQFPLCAAEQFTVYIIPRATTSVLSYQYTYIRSPRNVDTKLSIKRLRSPPKDDM